MRLLLAAHHVPAEGHILLHAADHGAAGRMVAEDLWREPAKDG